MIESMELNLTRMARGRAIRQNVAIANSVGLEV